MSLTCIRCGQKFGLESAAVCARAPDGGGHEPLMHSFILGRLDGRCARLVGAGVMCGYEADDERVHPAEWAEDDDVCAELRHLAVTWFGEGATASRDICLGAVDEIERLRAAVERVREVCEVTEPSLAFMVPKERVLAALEGDDA